jgi:hypothetical protein
VAAAADSYLTLAAIVATATVFTVMFARRPLERPGRLLVVVLLGGIWTGWWGERLHLHELQFDSIVRRQKRDLEATCVSLGGDIAAFARDRGQSAPAPPRASTWERDVTALLRYDEETSVLFEERFGARVRKAHDLLILEGIRDRDFDAFYRHPANAFQINVVAAKLVALARRLEHG